MKGKECLLSRVMHAQRRHLLQKSGAQRSLEGKCRRCEGHLGPSSDLCDADVHLEELPGITGYLSQCSLPTDIDLFRGVVINTDARKPGNNELGHDLLPAQYQRVECVTYVGHGNWSKGFWVIYLFLGGSVYDGLGRYLCPSGGQSISGQL